MKTIILLLALHSQCDSIPLKPRKIDTIYTQSGKMFVRYYAGTTKDTVYKKNARRVDISDSGVFIDGKKQTKKVVMIDNVGEVNIGGNRPTSNKKAPKKGHQ